MVVRVLGALFASVVAFLALVVASALFNTSGIIHFVFLAADTFLPILLFALILQRGFDRRTILISVLGPLLLLLAAGGWYIYHRPSQSTAWQSLR